MSASVMPEPSRSAVSATDGEIEVALKGLMDRYGAGLLGEAGRLKSFLQDECPNAKREISVLLQALDEQVPQDLLRVHSGEPLQSLGPRLAKRLSEQKALAPDASRWAVRAWAQGLGVSAAAMDLGAPAHLDESTLSSSALDADPHRAANDWIEISLPGQWTSATRGDAGHPTDPQSSTDTPQPDLAKQQTGGSTRRRARWLGLAVGVVIAVLTYIGLTAHPLEITRVDSSEALVADGKKRDVEVSFKPNPAIQAIQVRFVRGDGTWDAQPQTYNVPADAAARGSLQAGQLALRSVKAASATFEYVVIGADGKRGTPFERTFQFAAGPADPPVIATINAPRSVAIGKPYNFTIAYTAGAGGKVVSIERRVVNSSVKWQDDDLTTHVSDLPAAKAGTIGYPFVAMNVPSHQTLEFTLIDESGARSEPKQVTYDVAAAAPVARGGDPGCTSSTCGRVVAVREFEQQGEGTGIGAAIGGVVGGLFGHTVGKGKGNIAATLAGVAGGVFAGHEGEKYLRGTKSYEVTVRLDNGSTRTITQSGRVDPGARVRIAGGAAVVTND